MMVTPELPLLKSREGILFVRILLNVLHLYSTESKVTLKLPRQNLWLLADVYRRSAW